MNRSKTEAKKATKKKRKTVGNNHDDSVARFFGDVSKERLGEFTELAESVARSLPSKALPFEERCQYALIGIARGLETYQDGRSSETTWLSIKARFAVQGAIRQEIKRRGKDPTSKQAQYEDELFDLSPETTADSVYDDAEENVYLSELVKEALERLDERTREIVVAVHFQEKTQKEVADRYGISASWASRLYTRGWPC